MHRQAGGEKVKTGPFHTFEKSLLICWLNVTLENYVAREEGAQVATRLAAAGTSHAMS